MQHEADLRKKLKEMHAQLAESKDSIDKIADLEKRATDAEAKLAVEAEAASTSATAQIAGHQHISFRHV